MKLFFVLLLVLQPSLVLSDVEEINSFCGDLASKLADAKEFTPNETIKNATSELDCSQMQEICDQTGFSSNNFFNFMESFNSSIKSPLSKSVTYDNKSAFKFEASPPGFSIASPAFLMKPKLSYEDHCQCLKNKQPFEIIPGAAKKREENKLKELLRSSVQKKMLNDYASHFEDVLFSKANNGKIFHESDEKIREIESQKVLCENASDFEKEINSNAKCRRLSKDVLEKRQGDILNSFDKNLDGSFSEKLKKIQLQIIGVSSDPMVVNSNDDKRRKLDEEAFKAIAVSSKFQSADLIMTRFFKDPYLRTKLIAESKKSNESLEKAIITIVQEEMMKPEKNKLFTKENLGKPLFKIFNDSKATDRPEFLLELKVNLEFAKLHPGFGRLMGHRDLFQSVADHSSEYNSISSLLESEEYQRNHYQKNCANLIKNFAEIACSTDDEIFESVSVNDLTNLIGNSNSPKKKISELSAIIICDKSLAYPRDGSQIVPSLSSGRVSKYQQQMVKEKSAPSFDDVVNEGITKPQSSFGRFLRAASLKNAGRVVSVSNTSTLEKILGSDYIPKAQVVNGTPQPLTPTTSPTKEIEKSVGSGTSPGQQDSSFAPASYLGGPSVNKAAASGSSLKKVETPDEMREFLKRKSGAEEEINTIIDKADDKDLAELIKIKEEIEKSKIKIAELTAANEKLKLQLAEEKLTKLQKERAALDPGEPENVPSDSVKREKTFKPVSMNNSSPDQRSMIQNESFTQSTPPDQTQKASIGNGRITNRGTASFAGNASKFAENTSRPVVVSTSSARVGSIEVKSNEFKKDILNYIASNEADIQTLIKLKATGFIYKYKSEEDGIVVEKEVLIEYRNLNEDVKQMIDQKIASDKNYQNEIKRLDQEIVEQKRVYSYSALKIILGEQMKK